MPSLRFSQASRNLLLPCLDIDFAQVFIAFIVLLFSLTVHEIGACVDGRSPGRSDRAAAGPRLAQSRWCMPIRSARCVFPLLGMIERRAADRLGEAGAGQHRAGCGVTARDYVLVAAAGPASNLLHRDRARRCCWR